MPIKIALVLFLLCLPRFLTAQEVSSAHSEEFAIALALAEAGCAQEAALEFKRYLYLCDHRDLAKLEKAYAFLINYYQKRAQSHLALEYQRSLSSLYQGDLEKLKSAELREVALIFEMLTAPRPENRAARNLGLIMLNNWAWQAQKEAPSKKAAPSKANELHMAAFSALFYLEIQGQDWQEAEQLFIKGLQLYPNLFSPAEQCFFQNSLEAALSFKPKKLLLAGWLSLLPGLGQAYAHNNRDAANAFLLNGALIGLAAYSIASGNYIDFFAFELSPLMRFYQGNLYNAQRDAHLYNTAVYEAFAQPMLAMLKMRFYTLSGNSFITDK